MHAATALDALARVDHELETPPWPATEQGKGSGDMQGGRGDVKDGAEQRSHKGKSLLGDVGSSDRERPGRLRPRKDGTICEAP
jgi:hypothetical protein